MIYELGQDAALEVLGLTKTAVSPKWIGNKLNNQYARIFDGLPGGGPKGPYKAKVNKLVKRDIHGSNNLPYGGQSPSHSGFLGPEAQAGRRYARAKSPIDVSRGDAMLSHMRHLSTEAGLPGKLPRGRLSPKQIYKKHVTPEMDYPIRGEGNHSLERSPFGRDHVKLPATGNTMDDHLIGNTNFSDSSRLYNMPKADRAKLKSAPAPIPLGKRKTPGYRESVGDASGRLVSGGPSRAPAKTYQEARRIQGKKHAPIKRSLDNQRKKRRAELAKLPPSQHPWAKRQHQHFLADRRAELSAELAKLPAAQHPAAKLRHKSLTAERRKQREAEVAAFLAAKS